MLHAIVDLMTAWAESTQVLGVIVSWIVVQVGAGQHHKGSVDCHACLEEGWRCELEGSASTIAPDLSGTIPPATVAKVADKPTVRTAAALAATLGALETDHGR